MNLSYGNDLYDFHALLETDAEGRRPNNAGPVSYTHLRAHETVLDLVCRLLLEKKKKETKKKNNKIHTAKLCQYISKL